MLSEHTLKHYIKIIPFHYSSYENCLHAKNEDIYCSYNCCAKLHFLNYQQTYYVSNNDRVFKCLNATTKLSS